MLKLFGWESEMHERIAARREEEVKWLWKRKFYDVIIAIVKCVLSHISRMIFYTGPRQLSDPCFDYARYICISYTYMERRFKWYVNRNLQLRRIPSYLKAAKVFSSMAVFTLFRRSLSASFQGLSLFIEG